MSKKILIKKNALSMEMALLLDDELTQYYVDSALETNWQNRIVIGQVKQVVKNLNAVFVDYGADKNGMLHFKQIPEAYQNKVQQGFCLPVQITKQNVGEKGHKLTALLNMTGKYLVCMPFEPGIHVSKKVSDPAVRKEIKKALEAHLETSYGFIVRTHACEVPIEAVIEDAQQLICKMEQLIDSSHYLTKGNVMYEEPTPIEQMVISNLNKSEPLEIVYNDEALGERLKESTIEYGALDKVTLTYYKEGHTLFSIYGVAKKIEQLTRRKIWLKNGGNLVIDYTEAMTVIDVNSAKAILTKNPDKATLQLNKEATKEAILQILRRNLSGIILVDLVDMKKSEHKVEIYEYAKALLKQYDDQMTKVYPLTELGLLQFSRTKKYQGVVHKLLTTCESCFMPYTRESFLWAIMKLEEQLRGVDLKENKQAVYLQVVPDFYEKMIEQNVVQCLEKQYSVKIEMEKSHFKAEKNILCQFYKR